jgi:hypothetical protein
MRATLMRLVLAVVLFHVLVWFVWPIVLLPWQPLWRGSPPWSWAVSVILVVIAWRRGAFGR